MQVYGDEHPSVATSLNNLAILLKAQGKHDEAEPLYRESLAMMRRVSVLCDALDMMCGSCCCNDCRHKHAQFA